MSGGHRVGIARWGSARIGGLLRVVALPLAEQEEHNEHCESDSQECGDHGHPPREGNLSPTSSARCPIQSTLTRPYRHICVPDPAVHIAGYGRLASVDRVAGSRCLAGWCWSKRSPANRRTTGSSLPGRFGPPTPMRGPIATSLLILQLPAGSDQHRPRDPRLPNG